MPPHPRIRLLRVGSEPRGLGTEPTTFEPLPIGEVKNAIGAAEAAHAQWVLMGHHEPTLHPHLEDALFEVSSVGMRAKMTSNGRRLTHAYDVERLRDAGLAQITFPIFGGSAQSHDAATGNPGDWQAITEAIGHASRANNLRVTVELILLQSNLEEVDAIVDFASANGDLFRVIRPTTDDQGVPDSERCTDEQAIDAINRLWQLSATTHTNLEAVGFNAAPRVPCASSQKRHPVNASLLRLLRENVPMPLVNGTYAIPNNGDLSGLHPAAGIGSGLANLGLQFAAYGAPALDLPPCMGGRNLTHHEDRDDEPGLHAKAEACSTCPHDDTCDGVPQLLTSFFPKTEMGPHPTWFPIADSRRVVVINPFVSDNIMVLSTLPALSRKLKELGASTQCHSIWHHPINPYDPRHTRFDEPMGLGRTAEGASWLAYRDKAVDQLSNTRERIAWARSHNREFLATLDLTEVDLVVIPGFDNGLEILGNATFPADARMVIADFHMMTGITDWHKKYVKPGSRSMDGGWWPDERISVHNLYPRYVRAYWRAGVPMKQIHWHPYPIDREDFPVGRPPWECDQIFSGGNHQRNLQLLTATAQQLDPDRIHPITVFSSEDVAPPLVRRGQVRLGRFYEAIANSRFVVLPLSPDHRRPAGLSVMSMALASGRPVISTATEGAIDHLRHQVDSLLVPADDPTALANAIDQLDTDPDLLRKLTRGARDSGLRLSVGAWARTLLEGVDPYPTVNHRTDHHGPWYAW